MTFAVRASLLLALGPLACAGQPDSARRPGVEETDSERTPEPADAAGGRSGNLGGAAGREANGSAGSGGGAAGMTGAGGTGETGPPERDAGPKEAADGPITATDAGSKDARPAADTGPLILGDAGADDIAFNRSIKGTSVSFRTKVLPVLIQRCGKSGCHGDVFKDPLGPMGTKSNDDEILALQWLRGKTTCDKPAVKEKAYVNPERATNKALFDDTEGARKSYVWKKLTNAADICGSPMPKPADGQSWKRLSGDDKTKGTDLFTIFDWIAHGAG